MIRVMANYVHFETTTMAVWLGAILFLVGYCQAVQGLDLQPSALTIHGQPSPIG